MSEEVLRVLKMVEEGKIDADKASKLIEAINNKRENENLQMDKVLAVQSLENPIEEVKVEKEAVLLEEDKYEEKSFTGEKMFKVKVLSSDGDKVNVTLPVKFVKGMIKACGKIPNVNVEGMEGVDAKEMTDTVMAAIDSDMGGKIVDIQSSDGDIVEIVIE